MIVWKDAYEVGIEVVDNQHRELFAIAGRAFELLKNDFVTDKYDALVEILDELKDYAAYHFATEEEYLERIGFKKLFSHKIEHTAFLKEIEEIDLEDLDENQEDHMMKILQFIVDWIDRHILEKDQEFAVNK